MAVIINLKEIFSTDSQVEVSSKVNFNFNQLLALGVGQPGPIGPQGGDGLNGPVGLPGPVGPVGSMIFGVIPPVSVTAPAPSSIPATIETGDILITSDTVLKRVLPAISPTGWEKIADFNILVQNALGSNISPFVKLTPTSRIIKPRITSGTDLTNSLTPNDPSTKTEGLGPNYQTVLYNFNELKTSSVILSGGIIQISSNASSAKSFSALTAIDTVADTITINSHGLITGAYVTYSTEGGDPVGGLTNFTGYFVLFVDSNTIKLCETLEDTTTNSPIDLTATGTGSAPHKLLTYPASVDSMFPATSNLSVYSYFDATATPAKEFATTGKGYRHQFELGSIDTLGTSYTSSVSGPSYVISPSFENLRMRKYRLAYINTTPGDQATPGTYYLRAEYDLSSTGIQSSPESFAPRRNSEQIWKINKATSLVSSTRTVEMRLTNSVLLAENETASGIQVDGIFLKRSATFDGTTSPASYFGMGFDPTLSNSMNFMLSSGMTFSFNRTIRVGTTQVSPTGIEYTGTSGTTWSIYAPAKFIVATAINFQVVGSMSTTGKLVIGTVNTTTAADVRSLVITPTGEVQKVDAAPIPLGGIIMWSGLISTIPNGWALCDGANGTPDLRNRFIVGSAVDYGGSSATLVTSAPTKTGGSLTHTHTAVGTAITPGQLPPHQHEYQDAFYSENGGHKPTGNMIGSGDTDGDNGFYYRTRSGAASGTPPAPGQRPQTDVTGLGEIHTHTINSATVLPPYYALAFIMYVGVQVIATTTTTTSTTTAAPTTTTSTTLPPFGIYTPFTVINASYISSTGACSGSGPTTTLYHNGSGALPDVGDRIYTGSSGGGYYGGNAWMKINAESTVIQISNSGIVIDALGCGGFLYAPS